MVDRARRRGLLRTVTALRDGGACALELGFPFSDPIADGPVLEAAHEKALRDGTKWDDLLDALRTASPVLPTAVMTYANPLVHRGLDRSIGDLAAAGATGLIVPDLSFEESVPFRTAARHLGVAVVLLVAPGISPSPTGPDRAVVAGVPLPRKPLRDDGRSFPGLLDRPPAARRDRAPGRAGAPRVGRFRRPGPGELRASARERGRRGHRRQRPRRTAPP